ncbi:hypothetical protein DL96DRAFT_1559821 [Flagelloscypha sp. PMI_526]|nr:hypothetical protein DL96DRAFT_1559821 [Flagelloscypha sp. PMI_526]
MPCFADPAHELQVQVFRELAWVVSHSYDRAEWPFFAKQRTRVIYHTVYIEDAGDFPRFTQCLGTNSFPFTKYTKALCVYITVEDEDHDVVFYFVLPRMTGLVYLLFDIPEPVAAEQQATWLRATMMELKSLCHLTIDKELVAGIYDRRIVIPSVAHCYDVAILDDGDRGDGSPVNEQARINPCPRRHREQQASELKSQVLNVLEMTALRARGKKLQFLDRFGNFGQYER